IHIPLLGEGDKALVGAHPFRVGFTVLAQTWRWCGGGILLVVRLTAGRQPGHDASQNHQQTDLYELHGSSLVDHILLASSSRPTRARNASNRISIRASVSGCRRPADRT